MTPSRLLTLIAAASFCIAAAAQERSSPSPQERVAPAGRATAAEPTRANANPNADARPAAGPEAEAPRAPAHVIPMGLGSFGGVSSTQSPTLEGAMGSGARIPGTRIVRKVCPPGLQNRDGNCVPPVEGIMRP